MEGDQQIVTFNDAMILYIIAGRKSGATITHITGIEDALNGDLTQVGLDLALRKLIALGLIRQQGKRFITTTEFKERFSLHGKHIYEIVEHLQADLITHFAGQQLDDLSLPPQIVTERQHQRSLYRNCLELGLSIIFIIGCLGTIIGYFLRWTIPIFIFIIVFIIVFIGWTIISQIVITRRYKDQ